MSKISLRTSIIQGFLESGWTEEAFKKNLSKEEQRYLPTTPEFAGIIGKSYLNALVVRILPSRLYSTWSSLMNSLVLAQYSEQSLDLSELIAESATTLMGTSRTNTTLDCSKMNGTDQRKIPGVVLLAILHQVITEEERGKKGTITQAN